jgi:hypothetical protein
MSSGLRNRRELACRADGGVQPPSWFAVTCATPARCRGWARCCYPETSPARGGAAGCASTAAPRLLLCQLIGKKMGRGRSACWAVRASEVGAGRRPRTPRRRRSPITIVRMCETARAQRVKRLADIRRGYPRVGDQRLDVSSCRCAYIESMTATANGDSPVGVASGSPLALLIHRLVNRPVKPMSKTT